MNATLQSFSNTKELRDYFLKKFDKSDPNKKMSNAFHEVILSLWNKNNNNKSYAPHNFKNVLSELNPLFAGIAANDSKDLISFLLERFHQEINIIDTKNINDNMISNADQLNENKMFNIFSTDMMARYKSIISDLFYGILETKTQCTNCKRIKYNFQVYSFLEFPLEQINIYFTNQGRRQNFNGQGNPDIDLYECFEHYESLLQMTGDNKIYCSECNSSFDAFYQTLLYTTPNYLILNLNRGKNAVYECKVNFPNILNLCNYVVNKTNTVYQLQSVISHIGPSSMSGHFIAYCRHPQNNEWYKYNDSIVTKCTTQTQKEYLNGMPYILFYKTLNNE
jgi:ubiquitin C-terminal hydrolase